MKKFLLLVVFILLVYLNRHFILKSYAEWFYVENATKGADVILILSGNPATRVPKAIQLYQDGYAKKIMHTTTRHIGKYHNIFLSQTAKTAKVLKMENINSTRLKSLKGGATSTYDEAYDLARYAQKHNLKHIIIVTDRFHTRRSYYAFRKVFKKLNIPTKLEISGAVNNHYNESNWYRTERGITNYFLEPLKFFVYLFLDANYNGIKEI